MYVILLYLFDNGIDGFIQQYNQVYSILLIFNIQRCMQLHIIGNIQTYAGTLSVLGTSLILFSLSI